MYTCAKFGTGRFYKVKGMVFCYQNCSDLLWEKCSNDREKLEAEGPEFSKYLRSLEQFI